MKEVTCCFTGHRFIPKGEEERIGKKLKKEVIKLIKAGVFNFICGGAVGFDTLAALTVLELRKKYKHIKLSLILPYKNETKNWSEHNAQLYNYILSQADSVKYTWADYFDGVMQVRNCCMVACSSYCIAYRTKDEGGTAYTVDYARSRQLTCIMI